MTHLAILEASTCHREILLAMFEEFYASEAVLHPIPQSYHFRTLEELFSVNSLQKCFVFELAGAVVGYALLSCKFSHEAGGMEWWLEEFYIRKAHRGGGLGREFLQVLTQQAAQQKICRLRLEIEPENTRAAQLYESFGFESLPYAQLIRKGDFL